MTSPVPRGAPAGHITQTRSTERHAKRLWVTVIVAPWSNGNFSDTVAVLVAGSLLQA
jgi:hypothetical protein